MSESVDGSAVFRNLIRGVDQKIVDLEEFRERLRRLPAEAQEALGTLFEFWRLVCAQGGLSYDEGKGVIERLLENSVKDLICIAALVVEEQFVEPEKEAERRRALLTSLTFEG